jgi:hypothetical protein
VEFELELLDELLELELLLLLELLELLDELLIMLLPELLEEDEDETMPLLPELLRPATEIGLSSSSDIFSKIIVNEINKNVNLGIEG